MLPKTNPTTTDAWKELQSHFETISQKSLARLFAENPERNKTFSRSFESIHIDFSKNFLSVETVQLFEKLARECQLEEGKKAMRNGDEINQTEGRAVLHTALRNRSNQVYKTKGSDITSLVDEVLADIKAFSSKVQNGEWLGYTGKRIESIINIGIGGSDLGPFMITKALKPYAHPGIKTYFVSNVDASDLSEKLQEVNPETTLFIIASKTFTTQETMTNAKSARDWFMATANENEHIKKHFVAVSTNSEKVSEFGIDTQNMFEFWDWVGGRYSLWSAIGLSIACTVGYDHFEELLKGAEAMDKHFFETEGVTDNIPAMMALLGIWYNNFFGAETHAILPYDHLLSHLSRYLQQGDMESNGKYVDRNGEKIDYQSGQIIWGEPGTNGQHAFYQLIHQGTKLIPCDFIAAAKPPHDHFDHHDKLIANFIAQTEALMIGKSEQQVRQELANSGKSHEEIDRLVPFKVFEGNKPTNSILIEKLDPRTLGSLVAMYEHKIFVQGIIWNVFSFDQWGVELGKQLASSILGEIQGDESGNHDSSTDSLINKYKELRSH